MSQPSRRSTRVDILGDEVPPRVKEEPGYFLLADGTGERYDSRAQRYLEFCRSHGCPTDDEGALLRFFSTELAGLSIKTVEGYAAAIKRLIPRGGVRELPDSVMALIALKKKPTRKRKRTPRAIPLSIQQLIRMAEACPDSLAGTRDRAVLLIAFAAGLRPYDLIWMRREEVAFDGQRAVDIPRRKVVRGIGRELELIRVPAAEEAANCPVRALAAWLDQAPISRGPVFRAVDRHENVRTSHLSALSITHIVRRAAERAGFPNAAALTGESLTAGSKAHRAKAGLRMEGG